MGFTRIEIVTNLVKVKGVQDALGKLHVTGMTVFEALGCGIQYGAMEYDVKKPEHPELLPKQMLMVIVPDEEAAEKVAN